jgi:hypothetical protein
VTIEVKIQRQFSLRRIARQEGLASPYQPSHRIQ